MLHQRRLHRAGRRISYFSDTCEGGVFVDPAIGIDVGNTTARVGLVDRDMHSCLRVVSFPAAKALERLGQAVESLVRDLKHDRPLPVGASSCNPGLTSSLRDLPGTVDGTRPVTLVTPASARPLRVDYQDPGRLGPDRIANAVYALRAYPGVSRIVVSAGTAVTVDGVSADGIFVGGAILPGPDLQFRSLHQGTAALPLVEAHSSPPEFPGTSTESSIRSGVIIGIAGAVSLLVGRLKEVLGNDAVVIACGGAWPLIETVAALSCRHVPRCTLLGAALCAE